MQYKQIELELGVVPPSWYGTRAAGLDGNYEVQYTLYNWLGGHSSESGEDLENALFVKSEQNIHTRLYHPDTMHTFYIAANGDAYRSWKGKLKGRPVFNIRTNKVYKYVHPNSKQLTGYVK